MRIEKQQSAEVSTCGGTSDTNADRLTNEVALPGTVLAGRYEILDLIGEGGMGVLYSGKQINNGHKVAIKVLSSTEDKQAAFSRFKQEATLTGRLSHRNICQVYDYGSLDNGSPYLVMDFLAGETLASILKRERRLLPVRAIHVFSQLCDALSCAHKKGIVHRDLKPSNVMVEDDNGSEIVKLLDFGIAFSMSDDPRLQHGTEIFGSPYYMSPEQCSGKEMDRRTDIYSAGCLLYEMLTGQPPFVAATVQHVMNLHKKEAPLEPTCLAPNLHESLEQVVLKCLEKEPKNRYQTAAELKSALEQVALHLAIEEALSEGISLKEKAVPKRYTIFGITTYNATQRELVFAAAATGLAIILMIVAALVLRSR